ncbi:MAG: adenylyl-sulfate kinase [Halanaerobiales bacterium]
MDKAFTIWFTGISGSGKSTLSNEIKDFLIKKGHKVQVLDGDVLRNDIGGMFGYTRNERCSAARVYRLLARLLNENGIYVIVAAIAPYKEIRRINREKLNNYIEIYVNCPLEECIRRDVKGLYKKALNGEEKNVVGIDEPFEKPSNYDIQVNTKQETISVSSNRIKRFLDRRLGGEKDGE